MRQCTIITGPIHSGKTTWLKQMIEDSVERGNTVGGIVAEAVYDEGGNKAGFDALDITSGRREPLVREEKEGSSVKGQRVGRFILLETGLHRASSMVLRGAGLMSGVPEEESKPSDILCLDEVGPLEMAGKGFYPVLLRLLGEYEGRLILIAREGVYERLFRLVVGAGWEVEKVVPQEFPF